MVPELRFFDYVCKVYVSRCGGFRPALLQPAGESGSAAMKQWVSQFL